MLEGGGGGGDLGWREGGLGGVEGDSTGDKGVLGVAGSGVPVLFMSTFSVMTLLS